MLCISKSSLRSLIVFKSIKGSWKQKFENYCYRDSNVVVSMQNLVSVLRKTADP